MLSQTDESKKVREKKRDNMEETIKTTILDTRNYKCKSNIFRETNVVKLDNGTYQVLFYNVISERDDEIFIYPTIISNLSFEKNGIVGEYVIEKGKTNKKVLISSFNEKKIYINFLEGWNPVRAAKFIAGCFVEGATLYPVETKEFSFYLNETKVAVYPKDPNVLNHFGEIMIKCYTAKAAPKGM